MGVCWVGSVGCWGFYLICIIFVFDNGCGIFVVVDWLGEMGGCWSEVVFFGFDLGDGDIVYVWIR